MCYKNDIIIRQIIVWALLVALLTAALTGLVLLFIGGHDDVLKVLLSVLIFAGALVLTLPAQIHQPVWVQVGTAALCGADAVLAWILIWLPVGSGTGVAIGRGAGMITALLIVVGVALLVRAMVLGPGLRAARAAAWVSHSTGITLLAMVWVAILSDGEVTAPGRVVAGLAIIYITSSLVAILIALMRRYTVVPRELGTNTRG
ncbi:MAG: hypothetical protein EXQ74_05850 [Thermoleophilia bacterium]|nr:hypothetical protein [Thermoleophilia bacterium]